MGQQHRYGRGRGIIAAGLVLCLMPAIGGCVARDYAGIPLQPGAAPADLQALALRARAGDKRAQFELGERYETGDTVRQDFNRSIKFYALAARSQPSTLYIYSPPVGNVPAQVRPVAIGAGQVGLLEAKQRLQALKRRVKR